MERVRNDPSGFDGGDHDKVSSLVNADRRLFCEGRKHSVIGVGTDDYLKFKVCGKNKVSNLVLLKTTREACRARRESRKGGKQGWTYQQ